MIATGVAFMWIFGLVWLLWFADGKSARNKAERESIEGEGWINPSHTKKQ